jgi:hypothetical protein
MLRADGGEARELDGAALLLAELGLADMEIVCDASELTGAYEAEAPNTFVVAGYSIFSEHVSSLIRGAEEIKKARLGNKNVPIKWNVKDLERALALHGSSELSSTIKSKSNEIRKTLLELLYCSGATLFLSIIQAYSNKKPVLGRTKDDLVRYSFGNFLMRVGLFCKERPLTDVQLIVDWPDGNKRSPFVQEFHSGWTNGESVSANTSVKYECGPLSSLGFRAGPLFGVTDVDVRLQLADLVVGACRSFVDYCMDATGKVDFGVQQFKSIAPHLDRRANGTSVGRGVSVAPARSEFSEKIVKGLNTLGC